MSNDEYKQYAVIADGKALAYAEMKETPDFLIARGGARYKKVVGMDSISKQAVGVLAAQKLKVGSHTTECHVYNIDHPTVLKLRDSNLKSQFRELTYRTFYANNTRLSYPDALFLNHAFNLGLHAPTLTSNKPKPTYSTQEQDWDFLGSVQETLTVLYERDQLVAGVVIWSGTLIPEDVTDYIPKAKRIVEDYGNNIVDNFGESADGHDGIAELKPSDYSELDRLIEAWFMKRVVPSCGVIENKEEIVVTDGMIDYFESRYRGSK